MRNDRHTIYDHGRFSHGSAGDMPPAFAAAKPPEKTPEELAALDLEIAAMVAANAPKSPWRSPRRVETVDLPTAPMADNVREPDFKMDESFESGRPVICLGNTALIETIPIEAPNLVALPELVTT